MSTELEFFFDYGSPFSFIANSQLADLEERTGAQVSYRPMLLGGVFKSTGNRSPAMEPVEAKRAHGGVDMARWVEVYELDFQFNPHFPINTIQLMRHAHAAQRLGVFETFHQVVWPAFWTEALNLGDASVLADVLKRGGLDAAALAEEAANQEVKDALRATTDEAVARGAFGAPTFFVGEEMFFGNDRLVLVERALKAHGE